MYALNISGSRNPLHSRLRKLVAGDTRSSCEQARDCLEKAPTGLKICRVGQLQIVLIVAVRLPRLSGYW